VLPAPPALDGGGGADAATVVGLEPGTARQGLQPARVVQARALSDALCKSRAHRRVAGAGALAHRLYAVDVRGELAPLRPQDTPAQPGRALLALQRRLGGAGEPRREVARAPGRGRRSGDFPGEGHSGGGGVGWA